jgi:hypothetical protein
MSDKQLNDFVALCSKILNTYRERNSFVKKRDPAIYALNKYKAVLDGTTADEHSDYFLSIFEDNRKHIINGTVITKDIKWLDEKTFVQFGQGVLKKPDPEYRIYLGTIFSRAKYLAESANTALAGKEVDDEALQKYPELEYPDLFLLYLYRVFKSMMTNKDDIKAISKPISRLEEILDLSSGEDKALNETSNNPFAQLGGLGNMGGLLNSLMSSMAPAMANVSSNGAAENKEMPSTQDLSTIFNNLVNNPATQNLLSKVVADAGNCNNINDIFSSIGKSVENSEFQGIVKGVLDEASGLKGINKGSSGPAGSPISITELPTASQIVEAAQKESVSDKVD